MHPLDRIINRIPPAVWNDRLDLAECAFATVGLLALMFVALVIGAAMRP